MAKDTIEIDQTNDKFIIRKDGKTYIGARQKLSKDKQHVDSLVFEEIDENDYDKRLERIAEKMAQAANPKDIILVALKLQSLHSIKRLETELFKKKAKPHRERGCYLLKAGNASLQIVG